MGGSKSRNCNDITREILIWCMQRQLALSGRDPFNQNFRKFRSKTQWIGSVQPEKFRKNWSTFCGGPLFPVGPVWSKNDRSIRPFRLILIPSPHGSVHPWCLPLEKWRPHLQVCIAAVFVTTFVTASKIYYHMNVTLLQVSVWWIYLSRLQKKIIQE